MANTLTKGRTHGHRWVRLDDPIFRARHWLFYGPQAKAQRAVKAVTGAYTVDAMPRGVVGGVSVMDGAGSVESVTHIDNGHDEVLDTLVHELHHVTVHTLVSANVPLCAETTELMAYYHEWLFREGRKGLGL